MFKLRSLFLILSLLALTPILFTPILAQTSTATLSGTVTDQQDAIVAGATVTITNPATGLVRTVQTGDNGTFVFALLQPATYRLSVERTGFTPYEVSEVTLNVGDQKSLLVQMKVGQVSGDVTVTPDASLVNTSPAVATTVDQTFVSNMPLNGRSFQSLITLAPGVVTVPGGQSGSQGEFSVNGQRTEANYFTVDGVSANTGAFPTSLGGAAGFSGSTPGETAIGTTQSLVSLDALQEFQIQTSTYSAEFGRTPGAQISLSSRPGTNDFHGTAFDYVRNEVFDANNWFNNANGIGRTPERQNDFGGTFGGPVVIPHFYSGRNKTFFFLSYEGLRLLIPIGAETQQYPSLSMRQNAPPTIQSILNAWPVPNGPDLGNGMAVYTAAFSNPSNVDATSIRVDHNFNDSFSIFGRYSDSPGANKSRSDSDLAEIFSFNSDVKSLTLGATNILSPRLNNDLRVNYTRNTGSFENILTTFGGAKPFAPGEIFGTLPAHFSTLVFLNFGSFPSLALGNEQNAQRQWNVADKLGVSFGPHILKFGFDYRQLATLSSHRTLEELFFFNNQTQVLQNSASRAVVRSAALIEPKPIYKNFSAFAQDDWKVNRRLTLSLGLRWEVNPSPGEANHRPPYTLDQITDLSTAELAPQGTPLWKTTYGNFAPRFGAAYMLRRAAGRETILRGGFGIFYDLGNTLGSGGFEGIGFGTAKTIRNVGIPLPPNQLTLSPPSIASPYSRTVYAFDPNLKLPYTLEWNLALEQSLGKNQTFNVSYVGAAGRRLLVDHFIDPSTLGNANFSDGNGLQLTTNQASSNYHSLQAQFKRRLSGGLQAIVSYTWAHAIDEVSSNFPSFSQLRRGNADFDVRHNFQGAVTYDIPGSYANRLANALLRHWSVDSRITARSGLPFDVGGFILPDPNGNLIQAGADLVPGVPIYISDSSAPGGRVVNLAAFTNPPDGQFGNAPRNFLRGFGAWQVDIGLRREFQLRERLRVQLRAEAFNLFNHPNFGAINNSLFAGPLFFGRASNTLNNQLLGLNALHQVGGPRSMQFSLRISF